ncbi:MAG: PEGA domain-containing protein [Candidatus Korobacteraceae bacterium]|jgi:PEGA domain-containing protein
MSRHLLSYVVVALVSVALVAQQTSQVSTPASPAPASQAAAVPATAAAQQPSAGILQDGVPIKLKLLNKLDSHTAKNGDQIPFEVVNDVVVGGVTVLHRGSPATGVVTQARSSETMGRAGRLSFTISDIQLRNGSEVPVRAFNRTSGENRTGEMIYYMLNAPMVAAPFFLLIHGTNTVFSRGTEINAFVNGDLRLDLASFAAPPPSTDTAGDELKTILQISSTPDDAQVQIDGAAAGSTPLNVTVTAGKHEIAIKKAGYSDWSKTLNVSGGTAHVEAVLEALTAQ